MKKALRIVALVLVLVTLGLVAASCGKKPSGKYSDPTGITSYEFKGKKYTYTTEVAGITSTVKGTYEIKDGNIILTPEKGASVTLPYALDGDTVTIGLVKYTKK